MDTSQSSGQKRPGSELSGEGKAKKSKSTNAYSKGFEQHLIDHGVYPAGHFKGKEKEEPSNVNDVRQRLAQRRSSMSPSRSSPNAFTEFKDCNEEATSEIDVMVNVVPKILGSTITAKAFNKEFNNLKHLTDGSIAIAQPDYYNGCRPAELNKTIRDELASYIVPSTNTSLPCLPKFFLEVKGLDGNNAVCKRQALYDPALGDRGVRKLLDYIDSSAASDSKAYAIAATYDRNTGYLEIFTAHVKKSEKPDIDHELRMTQLNGWGVVGNEDAYRQG